MPGRRRAGTAGRMTDPFLPRMISWIDQTRGQIRGDVIHGKLLALGFTGCERTTRTTLAELKAKCRPWNVRVHGLDAGSLASGFWLLASGFWLQYDYGDAPVVDVVKTVLFVAWLAFSRLRIVIVFRDKPMPSVLAPSTGRRLMKSPKLARNPPDELTQNPVRRPTTQSLVAAIGLSAVNVCLRTWRQLQARNTVPEGA
jgi:hypothetical protein